MWTSNRFLILVPLLFSIRSSFDMTGAKWLMTVHSTNVWVIRVIWFCVCACGVAFVSKLAIINKGFESLNILQTLACVDKTKSTAFIQQYSDYTHKCTQTVTQCPQLTNNKSTSVRWLTWRKTPFSLLPTSPSGSLPLFLTAFFYDSTKYIPPPFNSFYSISLCLLTLFFSPSLLSLWGL